MHRELILDSLPGADLADLRVRLASAGVESMPMKVGCLVAGNDRDLCNLFPDLSERTEGELAVPSVLRDLVAAVRIVGPRRLY